MPVYSKYDIPDVFKGSYWYRTWMSSDPDTIHNRIKFKEEFKIVGSIPYHNPKTGKPPLRGNRFKNEVNPEYPEHDHYLDHFEFYQREGDLGYVAIFSPYHDVSSWNKYYKEINEYGYKKYHMSLYHTPSEYHSLPTYILLVPKTKPKKKPRKNTQ